MIRELAWLSLAILISCAERTPQQATPPNETFAAKDALDEGRGLPPSGGSPEPELNKPVTCSLRRWNAHDASPT